MQTGSIQFSGEILTDIATKNAARIKARTKRLNITLLTSHVVIGALILGVIGISYRAPVEASSATTNNSILSQSVVSVDQIAAANVATSVAQVANLAIESNVSSLAISLNTKNDLAQTDNSVLDKPQIVSQTSHTGTTKYTVKDGDTVQSVAAKFGISEDTVRWANSLTPSASLTVGKDLTILGTTGILYTVKSGDTTDALATKYQADKSRIVTFNDLELTGLNAGQQIIIPDGVLPQNERPGYIAPVSLASGAAVASNLRVTVYGGNGYAYGYCTWYAYNRRLELGKPIGSNWGNAVSWAAYASAAGFRVDHTPEAGAVLQAGGGWGGYGHVAVVEHVNDDGSVYLSEMNYVGWNIISNRTVPASQASVYNYIH